MKKIIILLFTIFILVSCKNNDSSDLDLNSNTLESNEENIENKSNETADNGNVLIVYFSRAGENYNVGNIDVGNTAIMASYINESIDSALYEIVPTIKYPTSYEEMLEVSTNELENDSRPSISNLLDSIDSYQTIYLGYPIWHGNIPRIILSFLDSYDFSLKTIYPFVTHEGSGLSQTVNTLRNYLSDSTVLEGLAIRGSSIRQSESKEIVRSWVLSH